MRLCTGDQCLAIWGSKPALYLSISCEKNHNKKKNITMPKSKSKEYISDSGSSESESDEPKPKKSKKASGSKAKKPSSTEISFQLSKMRFMSVSEFRGKPYVNIREFYEDDGELKPGRKGISLSVDQWKNVKSHIKEIDEALEEFK